MTPLSELLSKAAALGRNSPKLERWARICEERIEGESYEERKARLDAAREELFGGGHDWKAAQHAEDDEVPF